MNATLTKPEILSPAGSLEAFFAAMEAGADAVYVGLKDFSARAKAKNFTLPELERMLWYAHGLGRKIYVTLNTLVKEQELAALTETLGALEAMQIDGVILQDLAVWRLAREHFPGLELHASTQMTIHNAAGVRMLEKMGFTRAVLARELSLEEIAAIRRQTTLELEHFVHGALCFSFSGQCYFSSWLGGKSGNRGRCAQPCRRRYRYRNQDGYYFSPNDLSAIELVPELSRAGVVSFKIEGRMKSAEYVANVVAAYRLVLDAPVAQRSAAVTEAKNLFKASFGRPPTKGFLPGGVPTDIAVPSVKGATGRFLGEVASVRDGAVAFKTRDRLHVGDRLRIQPKSDQAGTAFTIKTLQQGKQTVKKVAAGTFVTVPSPFRDVFRVGDGVFKVSAQTGFTMSEAACRRKLDQAQPAPSPVNLTIGVTETELCITGQTGSLVHSGRYPIASYPAQQQALSTEILRGVFAKTAEEPLVLDDLQTEPLPAIVVPPKRLNEIRRDFFRALRTALEAQRRATRQAHIRQAQEALLPQQQQQPPSRQGVTVAIRDLRDLQILNDPGVDRVLVPLSGGNLQKLGGLARRLSGREDCLVWDLPFIIFDSDWPHYLDAVRTLVRRGFTTFRLGNLGHFALFSGLDNLTLITSYRLFALNSQALLAWHGLGVREATLYIEDDRDNLAALLQRPLPLPCGMVVYGAPPLISSRIPLRNLRSDTPVISDRGEGYRVTRQGPVTEVTAEQDFSLLGQLRTLQQMGCGSITVDLSHLGPFSPAGKKVLDALKRDTAVPNTSPFNFDHGME